METKTALAALVGIIIGVGTGLTLSLVLKKKTEIVEITETGEERPVKRITTWTTI